MNCYVCNSFVLLHFTFSSAASESIANKLSDIQFKLVVDIQGTYTVLFWELWEWSFLNGKSVSLRMSLPLFDRNSNAEFIC